MERDKLPRSSPGPDAMYISLARWALTMAVLGRSAFADRSTKTFHYRLIATGQSNATCSVFISSCSWGQWGRAKVALMQKRPQTEPRAASTIRKPVVKVRASATKRCQGKTFSKQPITRASAHFKYKVAFCMPGLDHPARHTRVRVIHTPPRAVI